MEEKAGQKVNSNGIVTWVKRLGWGAFAFFLIKGLVWLAVFFGLFKAIT